MAWKGTYTKENPDGLKATRDDAPQFAFTVNPWPNENDQLNLITLSGSHNQKEFVQGQTIETGIKVENLDDNARERLVGQVYHPVTGDVVPGAEANIDDNGKVHVKMPEGALKLDAGKYVVNENSIFAKDPDYKGLTHLDVRFFARPRTKAEFKTIASEYYGTYTETGAGTATINHKGEKVTIDKQGLDRYDHYNLIGKFKLNLDDTKYYDQSFEDGNGDDTSKVTSSAVKPGEPFKVKMVEPENPKANQKTADEMNEAESNGEASGKLIMDFIKKENEGKAEKDQWKVKIKEGDIANFTITAPKSAKAGDFIAIPIEHTYTNGSKDVHWFHFVVQESVLNKPEYEAQVNFPSEEQTSPVKITENEKKLRPVKDSIKEGFDNKDDHGNEWAVSIDEDTGKVTAQPKNSDNFSGGEKLKVPVVAHYGDPLEPDEGITEETTAEFIIKERANMTPRYNAKAGKEGDKLSSDVILDEKDEFNRRPTKFTLNTNAYKDDKGNTWQVFIDETTGRVTTTVPDGENINGALVNVLVTAHYYDGEIEKGTRQTEVQFIASGTEGKYEKTLEIPFETKVEKNSSLKKGEIKVITEGKKRI